MNKYLVILIDSLYKKNEILDEIKKVLDSQELTLAKDPLDIDQINVLMDRKSELIDKMTQIDDGFTALYARVSPELKNNTVDYTDKIRDMQALIGEISEKTALIQAREMRIHSAIEKKLIDMKPSQTRAVSKADVASRYYKTMNKTTLPSSVFINKKN